jgi:hypothetical protein
MFKKKSYCFFVKNVEFVFHLKKRKEKEKNPSFLPFPIIGRISRLKMTRSNSITSVEEKQF